MWYVNAECSMCSFIVKKRSKCARIHFHSRLKQFFAVNNIRIFGFQSQKWNYFSKRNSKFYRGCHGRDNVILTVIFFWKVKSFCGCAGHRKRNNFVCVCPNVTYASPMGSTKNIIASQQQCQCVCRCIFVCKHTFNRAFPSITQSFATQIRLYFIDVVVRFARRTKYWRNISCSSSCTLRIKSIYTHAQSKIRGWYCVSISNGPAPQ